MASPDGGMLVWSGKARVDLGHGGRSEVRRRLVGLLLAGGLAFSRWRVRLRRGPVRRWAGSGWSSCQWWWLCPDLVLPALGGASVYSTAMAAAAGAWQRDAGGGGILPSPGSGPAAQAVRAAELAWTWGRARAD